MSMRLPHGSTKQCTKCGTIYPWSAAYFDRRPSRPIGLASHCKKCNNQRQREAYRRKPKQPRLKLVSSVPSHQTCTRCCVEYPATSQYFNWNPKMYSGLTSWCRECYREVARERMRTRRTDPTERLWVRAEKQRHARSAKGRETKRRQSVIQNHKRRERKLGVPWKWTASDWEECQQHWNNQCAYCGATEKLTQDHFIPLADPNCPGTVRTNIIPACNRCNTSKQHRNPDEWCASPSRLAAIRDYFNSLS